MLKRSFSHGKQIFSNIHSIAVTSKFSKNSYILSLKSSKFVHFKHLSTFPLVLPSKPDNVPNNDCYINEDDYRVDGKKVFIEVYGCQMNVSDTEIAYSILIQSGYKMADCIENSDVILLMTCSIREGAEQKIWKRLDYLEEIRKRKKKRKMSGLQIGILGCMAERLKMKILESNKNVDLICGPDSYRSLPRLLHDSSNGQAAANVLLSLDETYADIQPVRRKLDSPTAFISIMRGCNNMCTYCVVPFTRGRERSRDMGSVVGEVERLVEQGVKDITLLGQNVNSYHDTSAPLNFHSLSPTKREGFKTVYKSKSHYSGVHKFVDLLEGVSRVDGEVRVRFTSPHPKDFPDEMLQLMKERPNLCKHIHIPAQSGSDRVLESMGRGYGREVYMGVVEAIREALPGVALSSDFIAGFCGEEEVDHLATVALMQEVKYNMAFCFAYSMREKTRAYHRLEDDVPRDVKVRRATQLTDTFRSNADLLNKALIGSTQLVLVEGTSRRSVDFVSGRSDGNTKVILSRYIPTGSTSLEPPTSAHVTTTSGEEIKSGDYVAVKISSSTSQVLKGYPLCKTRLGEFYSNSDSQN